MSSNLKKCKECGNLFQYLGKDICPECVQKADDYFNAIRDYLDINPNANVKDISIELEIDERFILDFIKSGRIITKEAAVNCVNCGKPITTGSMCQACKEKLTSRIGATVEKKMQEQKQQQFDVKHTGGMHVKS